MRLITTFLLALGLWWILPARPERTTSRELAVSPDKSPSGKLTTAKPDLDRPAAEIVQQVRQSLRTGSAGDLADYFDKNIELMIDTEGIDFPSVNATQAEQVLKAFFRKHPPREFTYAYQGTAERFRYSTGTYQSAGNSYQVYILMRRSLGDDYLIYTLHIRKN